MIRIFLGNVGSGKTACCVRYMMLNQSNRPTFSNIITNKIKNNHVLSARMLVKKTVTPTPSGRGKPRVDLKLNVDYWKEVHEKYKAINVILDEAHTIFNSRRSMSKLNIIMNDWLALLRRVLGSTDSGGGELILISQIDKSIDSRAREMATQVRYHICHYMKRCKHCQYIWKENNETPEQKWQCPKCSSFQVKKENHVIEVWHFANMQKYELWKTMGMQLYHRHYFLNDIEKYFPYYNTLQWDNLISEDFESADEQ